MPNPGKSPELKKLIGSREPSPTLAISEPVAKIPSPPRRLEESGLQLWNQAWSLGWISLNADYTALALLCERMDERDILTNWLIENPDDWRQRAALRKLEDSIENSLKTLILTPEARLKAGVAEAKAKSKLDQLLELKAAKNG
jgi:hypothetical protein